MYIINGQAIRLEHVSLVGALSRVPGKPENVLGFRVVIMGNHEQLLIFDSAQAAIAAHANLLAALSSTPAAPASRVKRTQSATSVGVSRGRRKPDSAKG